MAKVPIDASIDVQRSISALNGELDALRKEISRLKGAADPSDDIDDLRKQIKTLANQTTGDILFDTNDVFRGAGAAHAVGLVPDPGLGAMPAGSERFLREDGAWIPGVTPFRIKADDPSNKYNIPGHLNVAGGIYCSKLTTGKVIDYGSDHQFCGVSVYNDANQTYAEGSWYTVLFNTELFDTHGFHSTTVNTSRLTVPTGLGGYYKMGGNINTSTAGSATFMQVTIQLGGAIVSYDFAQPYVAKNFLTGVVPVVRRLAAGDYIELVTETDGAGTATVLYGAEYSPNFWMYRLGV
jgi:hypothetical protein